MHNATHEPANEMDAVNLAIERPESDVYATKLRYVAGSLGDEEIHALMLEPEVTSVMRVAIARSDVQAIGRIVLNVRRAYTLLITDRMVYGDVRKGAKSVGEAAALGLAGELL